MEYNEKKSNSQQYNEEVNYIELIDIGRKEVNGDDVKLGLHYLNIALLSPNLDIQSKIQAQAIKSYAYFKLKDLNTILHITFKLLHEENFKLLETNSLFCLVRILYRCGSILIENKFYLVAAYCFNNAKKLFEYKNLRLERDSYETLETAIKSVLNTISQEVNKFYNCLLVDFRKKKKI